MRVFRHRWVIIYCECKWNFSQSMSRSSGRELMSSHEENLSADVFAILLF